MKQFQNFLHGTFTLFLRSNDDRSTTDRYLNLLMQALQKKLINYTQKVVSAEDHKICERRKVGKIILASRTLIFQFLSHLSAYVTVVFFPFMNALSSWNWIHANLTLCWLIWNRLSLTISLNFIIYYCLPTQRCSIVALKKYYLGVCTSRVVNKMQTWEEKGKSLFKKA